MKGRAGNGRGPPNTSGSSRLLPQAATWQGLEQLTATSSPYDDVSLSRRAPRGLLIEPARSPSINLLEHVTHRRESVSIRRLEMPRVIRISSHGHFTVEAIELAFSPPRLQKIIRSALLPQLSLHGAKWISRCIGRVRFARSLRRPGGDRRRARVVWSARGALGRHRVRTNVLRTLGLLRVPCGRLSGNGKTGRHGSRRGPRS